MKLYTDAVDSKGQFDPRYTCDIDNSSPELRWDDVPENTAAFVLIAEDLSTPGPFAHWVVYNISGELRHLPAGIPPQDNLPNGIRQGLNSFGKLGYGGPCPPHGSAAHRYIFRVYALDSVPELPPRATRETVLAAIQNRILASAQIEGHYQRLAEQMAG
jgi:Raf kinase inhibitor-like YbhB/YbcL family protein